MAWRMGLHPKRRCALHPQLRPSPFRQLGPAPASEICSKLKAFWPNIQLSYNLSDGSTITMLAHKIANVQVHLVSMPVPANFTDATRKVEMVGFTIVRLTTNEGLEGFGVTYHEVGGEATKQLILRNMAPRLKGRDPFDNELIWQDFFG